MSATVTTWDRFTYKHNGASVPGLPLPAPCPFCGRTDGVTIVCGRNFRYHSDCDCCGAEGPPGETPLDAARYWNARGGE